ncbi:MAG: insulinase family protein [FCB group bacterium]|nr:insulinase family protein [FCB group bacterium]MBL7029247.1 insulinase family protein [Candidatus Neomarinimicrobiota bacterium]MBL7123005.1 insulinase family protein [Candidatus Neomarinimicrobiota bacterium]
MPKIITMLMATLLCITVMAQPQTGDKMSGFKLVEKRFVKEVDAECLLFKHEQSGARLLKISNTDINKTFCITFKTVTESDAGTPHILEHSVLNGSKNFPVKSPFDILSKGSLNTFLNAMTGSDITLYPVSSMNDKDFRSLMHIYLDAVFNPLIYEDPHILEQEGWHHDLEHADSNMTYKGVVYNEMKGAFSSPTRELGYLVDKQLFPDTPYRFSSGGYPAAIPTLTHDDFLNFHRKYYHPSNSYIFLYGDGDTESELAFIDEHYLSKYSPSDQVVDIPLQPAFEALRSASGVYSATEESELEGNSYLSLSFVVGLSTDQLLGLGLRVLTQALFNNESAPVRLALQEAGIGKDVGAWIDDLKQNVLHIQVQDANPDEAEKFKQVVFETLEKVASEGLDKVAITGILNRMEFNLREGNTPQKGLYYNQKALGSWFWADEPFSGLEYEKPLAAFKQALPSGYLEGLITESLVNNPHALLFTLNPKPGLEGENDTRTNTELAAYKASLSSDEVTQLVDHTEMLVDYQKSEDTPEALATIPLLDLEDINPEADWFIADESRVSRIPYLHFETFTNDISYIRLFFDLRVLREDQLPYAALLATLLGSIGTENYTFGELDNALDTHLGGFSTYLSTYLQNRDDDQLIPKFVLSTKAMSPEQAKVFDFSEEILRRSQLDDVDRIKDVLTRHHSRLSANVKRDGLGYARTRLFSYTTRAGMFRELTGGLEYYWFISDMVDNFDTKQDDLINELKNVSEMLFNKKNLIASTTCSDDAIKLFRAELKGFSKGLGRQKPVFQDWTLTSNSKNEGLMAASKVQYVLKGSDFTDLGYSWDGKIKVLNQIISREWLKNQVRVIGGAYGGFARFSATGQVYFGSYRDPNLTSTLENYARTPDFLATLDIDQKEMTRFIIGTISGMDRPQTPSQRGSTAVARYFTRLSQEQLQSERTAVLATSLEDVKSYEKMVADILENSPLCVYGNEDKLKQNKELFEKLITLD